MENPFAVILSRINWVVFSTLTYRKLVSEPIAQRMLNGLVRQMMRAEGHGLDMVWLCRSEEGERFGRPHKHVLFADLPEVFVRRWCVLPFFKRRSAFQRCWESLGGGIARTRRCSVHDDALDYALKDLDGADYYELTKTGRSKGVTLSASLQKKVEYLLRKDALGGITRKKNGSRGTETKMTVRKLANDKADTSVEVGNSGPAW